MLADRVWGDVMAGGMSWSCVELVLCMSIDSVVSP